MFFWETLPGLIASWAAAFVALGWLGKKGWAAAVRSWRWLRNIVVSIDRLLEIGDESTWPNGSETLAQFNRAIYDRLEETTERFDTIDGEIAKSNELLEAYIKTHRQDHELLEGNP